MKLTPRLYAEALYSAVKTASGKELSMIARRFLLLLRRRRHWRMLPQIIRQFDQVLEREEGLIAVRVTTARAHGAEEEREWVRTVVRAVILKKEINTLQFSPEVAVVGEVMEVGDGVARVSGLGSVKMSEMVEFIPEKGACVSGVAMNLEEDSVGVIVLGEQERLKEGDEVRLTGRILSVPVGEGFIGRVVNPLGEPMDGKGKIVEASIGNVEASVRDKGRDITRSESGVNSRGQSREVAYYPVEKIAPGVIARESVNTPLQTGIKAIDAMIPIGRGQSELIIGDRQTGKTAIAMDTIVNQKGTGVICIYVAIGQKESKVAKMVADLEKSGAMEHTIVVIAGASSPAALWYIEIGR